MKKAILLILIYAICSFKISYGQEKMEVEGAIIIKNSEDPTPAPGTIRFNPNTNDFEGWNGIYWASLTGNQYEIGEMTDQDGNIYPTVVIGAQEWMAVNLRTTTFRNENPITLIDNDVSGNSTWITANYGAYAIYDTSGTGNPFDVNGFGYLYNWFAVSDSRQLCPTGWHVPTDAEWTILTTFLGGEPVAGGKMKATGTIQAGTGYWEDPNIGATNESGFTGLPGGHRSTFSGSFSSIGYSGYWWSSTGSSSSHAWDRNLNYFNDDVYRLDDDKKFGFSVRCVRD